MNGIAEGLVFIAIGAIIIIIIIKAVQGITGDENAD
jgi:hypothetical protein